MPGSGRTACQPCVQMWSKADPAPPALWGGDTVPDGRWPLLDLMLILEFGMWNSPLEWLGSHSGMGLGAGVGRRPAPCLLAVGPQSPGLSEPQRPSP